MGKVRNLGLYTQSRRRDAAVAILTNTMAAKNNVKNQGVSVTGKVVLVTGANRGIGKALVECVLQHGAAKVYACVRNLETAKVFEGNPKVIPMHMDLSQPDSIAKAAASSQDVHIVINNAGVLSRTHPFDRDAVAHFEKEMNINVYGLMHIARLFAPILKKNEGGALVQINSVASLRSSSQVVSTYSASKAAAYSMTQSIRMELQSQGTLVVSVHPGPIATDMIRQISRELADIAEPPAQVAEEVVQGMNDGVFHVYPDSKSKPLGQAFQPFATEFIEKSRTY